MTCINESQFKEQLSHMSPIEPSSEPSQKQKTFVKNVISAIEKIRAGTSKMRDVYNEWKQDDTEKIHAALKRRERDYNNWRKDEKDRAIQVISEELGVAATTTDTVQVSREKLINLVIELQDRSHI